MRPSSSPRRPYAVVRDAALSAAWAAVAAGGQAFGQGPGFAQTPPAPEAKAFATAMVQGDQYEISAAEDALAQSRNAAVRAFAQQMLDDHTRDLEAMRQAVRASGGAPPPAAMSGDQARMLSSLQSLRAAEFDQSYVRQQVLAHTQALAVAGSYASGGANGALRDTARASVPMIQRHLEAARSLKAAP